MTDITELAQSHELLIANGQQTADLLRHLADNEIDSDYFAVVSECESYGQETDAELSITEFALRAAGYVDALVEALEKAQTKAIEQGRTACELFDEVTALRQRIAELESHTVKPPVHPTVASENLDDETLQELIEFRRTTFEYHSKEGNKVQTIIHGVTLAALRELQERRKADSEPVAEVLSNRPGNDTSTIDRALPVGTQLYLHAQPAPVVSAELLHTAASAIEDLLTTKDRTGAFVWFDLPFRLRSAANAQPVTVVPDDVRQALSKMNDEIIAELDAEESACRAAMLAAAQQEEKGE